jgi:hypothetical protein
MVKKEDPHKKHESKPPDKPQPDAVFELKPVGSKIHVHLNGEIIHRANSMAAAQETVRKREKGFKQAVVHVDPELTRGGDGKSLPAGMFFGTGIGHALVPQPQFTLDQKIAFLKTNVRLVAKGASNSLLAVGEGGLGKTWNTMEVLKDSGLTDIRKTLMDHEVGTRVNMSKHYRFVKGTGSAKGLFRLLQENNGGLIILDDCDDLLKDKTAQNILKTALDTLNDRWITWQAEEPVGGTDLEREFEYTGRIIFLSNMAPETIQQALKTRALRADMTMNREEIVEYMERYMIPNEAFLPDITLKVKTDALDHIKEIRDMIPIKAFSARALIHACKLRMSGEEDWKAITTFNLTSKA